MIDNSEKAYRLPHELVEAYYESKHQINWPDDPKVKTMLVRALFGSELVDHLDTWLGYGFDYLDKLTSQTTRRNSRLHQQETRLRRTLATLDADQYRAVRYLIGELLTGLLFGILVAVDQPSTAKSIILQFVAWGAEDQEPIQIAPEQLEDLHDELRPWIWSFSRYAEDLVEVERLRGGYEFGNKGYE